MKNNQKKLQRAKLFLSYDALKGFNELLKTKERIIVSKRDLAPDSLYELDWKIKSLQPGQMVRVVYYDDNEYVLFEGLVSKVDLERKVLIVVNRQISFDRIVELDGQF